MQRTDHGARDGGVEARRLSRDGVGAIPKAGTPAHVRENRAAVDIRLTEQDFTALDRAFPPPEGPRPLEMI